MKPLRNSSSTKSEFSFFTYVDLEVLAAKGRSSLRLLGSDVSEMPRNVTNSFNGLIEAARGILYGDKNFTLDTLTIQNALLKAYLNELLEHSSNKTQRRALASEYQRAAAASLVETASEIIDYSSRCDYFIVKANHILEKLNYLSRNFTSSSHNRFSEFPELHQIVKDFENHEEYLTYSKDQIVDMLFKFLDALGECDRSPLFSKKLITHSEEGFRKTLSENRTKITELDALAIIDSER